MYFYMIYSIPVVAFLIGALMHLFQLCLSLLLFDFTFSILFAPSFIGAFQNGCLIDCICSLFVCFLLLKGLFIVFPTLTEKAKCTGPDLIITTTLSLLLWCEPL